MIYPIECVSRSLLLFIKYSITPCTINPMHPANSKKALLIADEEIKKKKSAYTVIIIIIIIIIRRCDLRFDSRNAKTVQRDDTAKWIDREIVKNWISIPITGYIILLLPLSSPGLF